MNGATKSEELFHPGAQAEAGIGGGRQDSGWSDSAGVRRGGFRSFLRSFLGLFLPPKGERHLPTATGYVLLFLAVLIGVAAYNSASNILFISLSLILSTLLLSGLLSWFNFRRSRWRIISSGPFRAGERALIQLEVQNEKRILSTYSLRFELTTGHAAETGVLFLEQRLDPGASTRLEWLFRPRKRGVEKMEVKGVSSHFPFGFLRKTVGGGLSETVRVWPARIPYELTDSGGNLIRMELNPSRRAGQGNDLIHMRDYQQGDSQRLIHWKATARMKRLIVRQFASERQTGFFIFLETSDADWREGEQFEKLCSFVASLTEDLFRKSQLSGIGVNDSPAILVKGYSDVAAFFDDLAILSVSSHPVSEVPSLKKNVITFKPDANHGVVAYVAGRKFASA